MILTIRLSGAALCSGRSVPWRLLRIKLWPKPVKLFTASTVPNVVERNCEVPTRSPIRAR